MAQRDEFQRGKYCSVSCNLIQLADGGYHCTKISPGCAHCWAEGISRQIGSGNYDSRPVEYRLLTHKLEILRNSTTPRVVFLCDLMDLFHVAVPRQIIVEIFAAMIAMPQHCFIVLTKRAAWAKTFFENDYRTRFGKGPLPWHIGIGVSCESQGLYNERAGLLGQITAETKIVSFAPLLGPIDFDSRQAPLLSHFDWVLIEAESRGKYPGRICDWRWVRDIVLEARARDVSVYVKQVHVGRRLVRHWSELPPGTPFREFPRRWIDAARQAGIYGRNSRG